MQKVNILEEFIKQAFGKVACELNIPDLNTNKKTIVQAINEINELVSNLNIDATILQFPDIYSFPTIGSEKTLYITTKDNGAYRWDKSDLKYYKISADESTDVITNIICGTGDE